MDKRKLNYRFHNPNPPEVLGRVLLRVCVNANMNKVEEAVRRDAERENALRVIAIAKCAEVAKLREETLFKMPKGKYEGRYYRINNEYINERSDEIVLELPSDTEISLLDDRQQTKEKLKLDKFVKAVVGKNAKDYEEKFRLPSAIYAEQTKNNPINQTTMQSVK